MPQSTPTSHDDLALTVFLQGVAAGRRVLWVGDPSSGGPERLASFAHDVRVLDTTGRARRRRAGSARISALPTAALELDAGAFDVAVIPDIGVFADLTARLQEVAAALGDGVLVAGFDAEPGTYDLVAPAFKSAFREMRLMGQGRFAGAAIADLDHAGDASLVVDGSLVAARAEPLERYLVLAADELPGVDSFLLVQTPSSAPPPMADHEREVGTLRQELERAESRLTQAQVRLVATESELAESRAALKRDDAPASRDEWLELEDKLRVTARRALVDRAELARRETLVRDLVEELREHRAGRRGSSDDRVMEAEAARVAAEFANDELRALLASGAPVGDGGGLAEARARLADAEARVSAAESRASEAEARASEAEAREATTSQFPVPSGPSTSERAAESERRLSAQVGALSGRLVDAEGRVAEAGEARDRARSETLKLTAQIGALETRMEGMRLGYETRIAMAEPPVDHAAEARHRKEVAHLRGEREGLQMRLADLEASMAARAAAPAEPKESNDALRDRLDALQSEVEALRGEHGELSLRGVDLQQERDDLAAKVRDLSAAIAGRDALVTRLQMDLAEEEQVARSHDQQVARIQEENRRLREGILEASKSVDERERALARVAALDEELGALKARTSEERQQSEGALSEMHAAVAAERESAVAQARSESAARLEELETRSAARLEELETRSGARIQELETALTESRAHRSEELEQLREKQLADREASLGTLRELRSLLDAFRVAHDERATRASITAVGVDAPDEDPTTRYEREAADKDTLLRSLTAQLEERDDRIRALTRRAAGQGPSDGGEGALMELEERVGRLQEELHHERSARSDAERRLDEVAPRDDDDTLRDLEARVREREAALQEARSRVDSVEKDVESLRTVCASTRHGLEELLGDATGAADPTTAERLGALLSVLSRF